MRSRFIQLKRNEASMTSAKETEYEPLVGHCSCKAIQYTLLALPLITHCCHCTYCQRETGSAFDINASFETYNLQITSTKSPITTNTPSSNGIDHQIRRCSDCFTALYTQYKNQEGLLFVKVGTLAEGSRHRVKPDVHIYTSTKVEWLDLSSEAKRGVGIYEEHYDRESVWQKDSLLRREELLTWVAKEKDRKETTIE